MAVLASAIMDRSASLLNDASKTLYSYTVQLPLLQSAYDKLQLALLKNGVNVLKEISAVIDVNADAETITSPSDLVSVISVEERERDTTDLWNPVEEVDEIPDLVEQSDQILYWTFQEETIKINAPDTNREVKLKYWKTPTSITSQSSSISILNSTEYLANKTAALCAKFIGENPTRASELDVEAAIALDDLLSIEAKSKQGLPVRPKPYGFKDRVTAFFIR